MEGITISFDTIMLVFISLLVVAFIFLIKILYNINKLVKTNTKSIGKTLAELSATLENANKLTANLVEKENEINDLIVNVENITKDAAVISSSIVHVVEEANNFVSSASDMASNVSRVMDLVGAAQEQFGEENE